MSATRRRLRTVGVGLRGAGYPNAEQTLRALKASGNWTIKDNAHWLPEGVHLWRVARGPWLGRLALAMRLLLGSAASTLKCLVAMRRPEIGFAPYPAIFALWWLSWVPRALRPLVVADAYISIWDSMYRDRARAASPGIANRMIKAFEARALRAAHRVVVDTVANREWMVAEFRLDASRVFALPLAIDAKPLLPIPPLEVRPASRPLRVVFVGTLIPLHGIDTIANAIRLVGADAGIEFEIIGDGQDAPVLVRLEQASDRAPLQWVRRWLELPAIAARIAQADVCLGVFGGEAKASRVLPYKLYMALAAGRAIITQDQGSLPSTVPAPPWVGTAPDANAITAAILRLRDHPDQVVALGVAARHYFLQHLSPGCLPIRWERMLLTSGTTG